MRRTSTQHDDFELLPTAPDDDSGHPETLPASKGTVSKDFDASSTKGRHGHTGGSPRPRLPGAKELSYVLPLAVSVLPLALLLGYSNQLSNRLADSACTPGGNFVMPYNSSIFDPRKFFEITMPFVGREPSSCSMSVTDPFAEPDCLGYTFTEVKVIDLAWDVLVGRGGQGLLVVFAYGLFSRIIVALMAHDEVGFDAFATVAFETGSLRSIIPLFRHALGLTPVPRTRRAICSYVGMLLATAYIVAVPSLLSAMTGYVSRFTPYMRLGSVQGSNGTLVSCYPGLYPVWGRLGLSDLSMEMGQSIGIYPVAETNISMITWQQSYMWIEYYDRYRSVYEECPQSLDISSCDAARKETVLSYDYGSGVANHQVSSPMPGILPYDNRTDSAGKEHPRYWQCGYDQLIDSHGLIQSPDFDVNSRVDDQSAGTCQADTSYAWGFSFLFSLLMAILHLLFTLLMYALWFANRRGWKASNRSVAPGTFPDAVMMVTQAQKHYDVYLDEWTATGLKKEIEQGKLGMSLVGDESLRRRKRNESSALGDVHHGDWGS